MRYASDWENPPFTEKDYNRFGKTIQNINERLKYIGIAYSVSKETNYMFTVNKHFINNGVLCCKMEYKGTEEDTLKYLKALSKGIALTY